MFNVKLAYLPAMELAFGYYMEGTIKLPQLRSLVADDMAGDIVVTGCKGGWTIGVYVGPVEPLVLATATGAVRVFTTSDSAIHQLIRLGVTRFEVVADEYESGTLRAPRPDRADVLRQQVEYDQWLTERIAATKARIAEGSETMLSPEEAAAFFEQLSDDLKMGRSRR
jgi:hypothetical protein